MISYVGIYGLGVYYCYGYIFKVEIHLGVRATIKPDAESKSARILILVLGVVFIVSTLLSLSGYIYIPTLIGLED